MAPAQYMGGYKICKLLIEALVKEMAITVPVAIHLDHGNYEAARACIDAGYTSIMFDGSMLPLEENLEKSKDLIKRAHKKGMSVECEVGSVGGSEDGIYGAGELAPVEAAEQMAELGVDFLAAGIGNIHGRYPENWKGLNLEHLRKLTTALPELPFVLHGGSGIPDEQTQAAIALGIAKVNVNTECHLAFAAATRDMVHRFDANETEFLDKKYYDLRTLLRPGFDAIEKVVKEKIGLFGSENF
jgi:fructose-bisphosphate aldolase class II